ncbi:hypothetical protein Pelo_17669 [Pelomyxa schiedti]|nr:hypothetical protein Pelo_17669 [Pelomyxa schiedti]
MLGHNKRGCAEWLFHKLKFTLPAVLSELENKRWLMAAVDIGTWKLILKLFPNITRDVAIMHFMYIIVSTPLHAQFTVNNINLGITLDDIKDFCNANKRDPDLFQTSRHTQRSPSHSQVDTSPTGTSVVVQWDNAASLQHELTMLSATRKETATDQAGALCAGLHPRCGAGCPLRRVAAAATTNRGMAAVAATVDATLVVRLVWQWIRENSRFYCFTWSSYFDLQHSVPPQMVTFGVSMALMTLTHGMKWWAERRGENMLGSSLHYLVVSDRGKVVFLQDTETGERTPLLRYTGTNFSDDLATNGRWVVFCDTRSMMMVVAEIPVRKNSNGGSIAVRKILVKLDPRWRFCVPQFVGILNENHLLLFCYDEPLHPTFFELVLVDIVETCSSKRLTVLSSTVPRLSDLPPSIAHFGTFLYRPYPVFRRRKDLEGGTNHLFVMREGVGSPHGYCNFTIEEGTGKLGRAFPESRTYTKRVSQVNQSQFGVMDDSSDSEEHSVWDANNAGKPDRGPECQSGHTEGYSVWDVNNASKPVRGRECLSGCTTIQAFIEGGLLFQLSEARKEIHVTEEATGVHVITLKLFSSLSRITSHFSFSLTGSSFDF